MQQKGALLGKLVKRLLGDGAHAMTVNEAIDEMLSEEGLSEVEKIALQRVARGG